MAVPSSAAALSDAEYLQFADRIAQCLDRTWDAEDGCYRTGNPRPSRGRSRSLTRLGSWSGAARAGAVARSAWTPGAGSNFSRGLRRAVSSRSVRCCVINGTTRDRHWSPAAARAELRRTAAAAGVRRRFAPHQLRHATPSKPRHQLCRPPRHRQRRDHRNRPRPTRADDPRKHLNAALIDSGARRSSLRMQQHDDDRRSQHRP